MDKPLWPSERCGNSWILCVSDQSTILFSCSLPNERSTSERTSIYQHIRRSQTKRTLFNIIMFYVLWRSSTSLIAAREILLYCNFVASAISKQDSTAHPNELVLAGEFVIKKKKKNDTPIILPLWGCPAVSLTNSVSHVLYEPLPSFELWPMTNEWRLSVCIRPDYWKKLVTPTEAINRNTTSICVQHGVFKLGKTLKGCLS